MEPIVCGRNSRDKTTPCHINAAPWDMEDVFRCMPCPTSGVSMGVVVGMVIGMVVVVGMGRSMGSWHGGRLVVGMVVVGMVVGIVEGMAVRVVVGVAMGSWHGGTWHGNGHCGGCGGGRGSGYSNWCVNG